MCLYPLIIKNRKYTKTKKNEGNIPWLHDPRIEYVPCACGNCIECRKQYARNWQVRLLEHIKTKKNGKFITLTFSNDSINDLLQFSTKRTDKQTGEIKTIKILDTKGYDRDNLIATKAIRLFLERWRKKYKKSLEHWLVTELGHKGTENIHLHGIIWTDEPMLTVEEIWNYGFMWKGYSKNGKLQNYVNGKTVTYITKYISKRDEKHKEYKSKILTSTGIGGLYTKTKDANKNKYREEKTKEVYTTSTGHEIALPIYWRNKIYTEDEREQLWIQKLNKEERWVCGEKVSIKNGQEQYEKLRQEYRRRNKELGYGQRPNDNKKREEEIRREIMIQTRLRNIKKR